MSSFGQRVGERRVYERVPYFGRVAVATPPEGPAVECRSCNISLNGVGLVWPGTPVPRTGVAVGLIFHVAAGAAPERVYGRAAWTRADADCCMVGVEFLEPLSPESCPRLSRLVARL